MNARVRYYFVTLLFFIALLSSSTRAAYGYVDPGSGLLVYQSVTACITGVLFYFRRRLKAMFLRARSHRNQ